MIIGEGGDIRKKNVCKMEMKKKTKTLIGKGKEKCMLGMVKSEERKDNKLEGEEEELH